MAETDVARYFVAKSDSFERLSTAAKSCIWGVKDRQTAPQPRESLTNAFHAQPVILVFSINNRHGWHGVASMETVPTATADTNGWHTFRIRWQTLFLNDFGDRGLSHAKTEDLKLDESTPLNKARNLVEIPTETGKILCDRIAEHLEALTEAKRVSMATKIAAQEEAAFFIPSPGATEEDVWSQLIRRVQQLGTVLVACTFGSQRYNLHTPDSDVDMFVVYAAPTNEMLGFNPPQHTFKSRDTETCDYTVHEVHRYCELAISGDPRCVETLFIDPSCVVMETDAWRGLVEMRCLFLTKLCLEKYVRDATGGKGTKLLDKWVASGVALETPIPQKVAKLFYIILRLLQNAREVCDGELRVYRPDGSPERELLLAIRRRQLDYETLRGKVNSLLEEINASKEKISTSEKSQRDLKTPVEKWLINLRYENLKDFMEK